MPRYRPFEPKRTGRVPDRIYDRIVAKGDLSLWEPVPMGSLKGAAVDWLIPRAFERVEVACRAPGADVEVT